MNDCIAKLQGKRRYASVLMTYSCTIECDHCCFSCSPRVPSNVVSVEDAVGYLEEFHKLDRAVHIAGGEPFTFYDHLRAILTAAKERNVSPHFIETNASWCTSDERTRERMEELKSLGVLWMLVSTDHYHLRLVPLENIWRGIAIAEEVFGADTTMGKRRRCDLERTVAASRNEEQRVQLVRDHPPKLVGRARRRFASYIESRPLAELKLKTGWGLDPEDTCDREWGPLWEIHADPYGNVQTNCGVVLGNAKKTRITEIMQTWHERNSLLGAFSKRGVAALLDAAVARGFAPKDRYPQKCLLCIELRTFLRDSDPSSREVFGPDEVYRELR